MRIFLAGIMQGSHVTAALHEQDYRQRLYDLLVSHLPGATVYDPLADHRGSLDYDADRGRQVFLHHIQLCREVDVVLAFVPEASMGTAIEMWEAYHNGRVVIAVSPMKHNWAVKFLSHQLYADLDEFEQALASGQVAREIDRVLAH
jgi:hypothetical protein